MLAVKNKKSNTASTECGIWRLRNSRRAFYVYVYDHVTVVAAATKYQSNLLSFKLALSYSSLLFIHAITG